MTRTAIQFIDPCEDREEAEGDLVGLALQDGFLGGRVLEPTNAANKYRVQAFFEDDQPGPEGFKPYDWLPDGCRRVFLPPSLMGSMTATARP